ncbi:hypothetical protein E6O75_ATG09780 [Venturia nashicola]|uniref:Uncharacterized protein n=1 Tax=Venturia nashicola TaxID=86259 RepID=A0A4Z1NRN6_9PEZI|nr:hypothetical protein E6O75_ATG09780 [Venturia nashicola]
MYGDNSRVKQWSGNLTGSLAKQCPEVLSAWTKEVHKTLLVWLDYECDGHAVAVQKSTDAFGLVSYDTAGNERFSDRKRMVCKIWRAGDEFLAMKALHIHIPLLLALAWAWAWAITIRTPITDKPHAVKICVLPCPALELDVAVVPS